MKLILEPGSVTPDPILGPHFSPDGGRFYGKPDGLYWEDGEITPQLRAGMAMRYISSDCEDFSQWSTEKRRAVQAETKRRRALEKKQYDEMEAEWLVLVKSAASKLTKEEFEALAYAEPYEFDRVEV